MPTQPNKPGGSLDHDGAVRPAEDRQAVENQSTVTPDDYPSTDGGKPNYADRDKA